MIVTLFLDAIFGGIVWLIGLLPAVPIPEALPMGIGQVFSLIASVGFLLPLETVGYCLTIILVVYGIKFFISSTSYVARKIPTIS